MHDQYTALPLLTDTEAENSFDLDKSFKEISKVAENTTFKRRSLFNLSVESELLKREAARKSEEFKSLELGAKKEIKDWHGIYEGLKNELLKTRERQMVIDTSILSEEKRKFLSKAPDMDRYLRTLHEFQCNALQFLEEDYPNMMVRRQHVATLCQDRMLIAKQAKINELINNDDVI